MVCNVARNSQEPFWLALRVADGTDQDVPPPGLFRNRRGEISNKAPSAALPRRLHSSLRSLPVLTLPEINPRIVHHRAQIANFERLHAPFVHCQKSALQVKH